ncbi:NAD(P)-binding protein [Roridomyces roridus]|uniref:NAD(P)-binding protein n=1 Tax=Roridomyces roridus TaxID=1738132 RepID=A0AAD7B5J3_9AGAR|nr:NAD(P)-binding protein [Roridomyces roridus]
MTITQDPSAPLVAVVGATGNQGGSVVAALAESGKAYRIRAFTRDSTKPAARSLADRGVDVVEVSLTVDNREKVFEAFKGADYAFLVTNFLEHCDVSRETAEGKLLIDAAAAASPSGIRGIIWSGLPPFAALTSGKYRNILHSEGKAAITAYGRACGVPFVDVQAGYYTSNYLGGPTSAEKRADGEYVIAWPMRAETLVPVIVIERDYGLFVRAVLEMPEFPAGREFITYGELISNAELVAQIAKGTGKNVTFEQVPLSHFKARLEAAKYPPHLVRDLCEFAQYWDEFGLHPPGADASLLQLVARPHRTWAQFVKEADWGRVLA